MSTAVLYFALSAALLLGALLTIAGAVGLEGVPTAQVGDGVDHDLRPFAAGIGVFGLLVFIAAASAILNNLGAAA